MNFLERWFREHGFARASVDAETRDAILEAEGARIEHWANGAKLSERGIDVDAGCTGSFARGLTLTIHLGGLGNRVTITEKRRANHPLDALFDDLTLSGALYSVDITPQKVTLRFVPMRSTEVYDVALQRLDEIIEEMRHVEIDPSGDGPYR